MLRRVPRRHAVADRIDSCDRSCQPSSPGPSTAAAAGTTGVRSSTAATEGRAGTTRGRLPSDAGSVGGGDTRRSRARGCRCAELRRSTRCAGNDGVEEQLGCHGERGRRHRHRDRSRQCSNRSHASSGGGSGTVARIGAKDPGRDHPSDFGVGDHGRVRAVLDVHGRCR